MAIFFQRGMLDRELEQTELITLLLHNVCGKLAEQNCEVSEHSYIDLHSNNRPRQDYQSNLFPEPISTRMERHIGTKRTACPGYLSPSVTPRGAAQSGIPAPTFDSTPPKSRNLRIRILNSCDKSTVFLPAI